MNADDRVNILLVDDQPAKLLSYEAILSPLGEHLLMAGSGREALELLLRHEVALVLMDVSMPDLDGFELAELIRSHPRYRKTAIIFVSAVHLTDLDQLKGYESGAVDYVPVPVVPQVLRAKVAVFAELYRKTRESDRLNRELEQRVTERTAELQASMARQIELADQLRLADQRKDHFLALLAHELRNPLAPVTNAVEIMRRSAITDPQLIRCREIIERQTAQLTRLVDDLLDVSRITLGKIRLRMEQGDLRSAVSGALETSRPNIDRSGHRLTISLPERPIRIRGDQARLTQVIANLLNNAAKFQNERGWIELAVSVRNDQAWITVRDGGFGIAPEAMSTLFSLFAQGERSPSSQYGGLGVGLSLARTLVEMHGGTITAESGGPGQGSQFTVTLPCLPVEESSGDNRSAQDSFAAGSRRRILVVDDSRDAAETLALLLQLDGHDVLVAHDGERAVELAVHERPAVMLLDIGLPGMDGYEVCRRLRAEGLSETTIIAMTGYGQERDKQRSSEAGFDGHTVKPVEMEEISKILAAARS